MARNKRRPKLAASSFAFLSVLTCLVGSLLLLIATQATIDPDAGDTDAFQQLLARIAAEQKDAAELEAQIANSERLVQQHREQEARLARMQGREDDGPKDDADARRRLQRRIAGLRDQVERFGRTNEQLQGELSRRQRPGGSKRIAISGGGSGSNLLPVFVECTRSGLLIHARDEHAPVQVSAGSIEGSAVLARHFNKIKSRPTARVIFLVRPNGVPAHDRAARVARRLGVKHGKLPVPGYGELDLSQFYTS